MKNSAQGLLAFALILVPITMFAQGEMGSITGKVRNPIGGPVAGASVQATNVSTREVYKATSTAQGAYTLTNLPSGSYDVSVTLPGVAPFLLKGVEVSASKTVPSDIDLKEGTQLSTLGEDPLSIATDLERHHPPSGPTPRTFEGKPDLSGVWWSPRTIDPGKPEFLPAAVEITKKRVEDNRKDSPPAHCLPNSVIRIGPLYELVQAKSYLVMISDDDSPGFHQIYLDGRSHPKEPDPQWYGHSIGHWEGDTLVVDRVNFEARVWLDLDAHPHTDQLHVIERYRRIDLGHLETEVTV